MADRGRPDSANPTNQTRTRNQLHAVKVGDRLVPQPIVRAERDFR